MITIKDINNIKLRITGIAVPKLHTKDIAVVKEVNNIALEQKKNEREKKQQNRNKKEKQKVSTKQKKKKKKKE